jgi:hypothetical protein
VAVVLLTFLFKEVLRDNAKDKVAAMESAQRAYDSRFATDLIDSQLATVIEKIRIILDNLAKRNEDHNPEVLGGPYPNEGLRSYFRDDYNSAWLSLTGRLTMLCESLEGAKKKEARKEIELFKEALLKIRRSLSEPLPPGIDIDGIYMACIAAMRYIHHELGDFEKRLVEEVTQEARKGSHDLKKFTYLSYFLYPAGVLIGVFGQLAGVKTAGGE